MAAPASKTIKSLDGKWIINKTLGESPDPVLALQGVGWVTRKAIGLATVTQHLTTSTDANGSTVIDINQLATGGVKGTKEHRVLDWQYRDHSDWLFGDLKGKSRYTTIAQILQESKGQEDIEDDAKFLAEGWLPETESGEVVESYVDNEGKGWTGWQIWGFAEVEVGGKKERYFTRRFVVRKGKEAVKVRMVYDWAGELEG